MALLCVLNYVLNKSGLVCRWYTVGVIVKETNIVTLYVGLYAFIFVSRFPVLKFETWAARIAVHKASTDVLHYFALLSVEARVCKYMT